MKALITALAAAFLFASAAAAQTEPVRTTSSERTAQVELASLRQQIVRLRNTTWGCQDALGVRRTRVEYGTWAMPPSLPFRGWMVVQWRKNTAACQRHLRERTIGMTWDWLTAVDRVQRIYPGTKSWLLYISHREGGWGRFVMNTQGSGAGGWMQFMASTFYAYNDRAFADARSRGFIVNEAANRWTHPLGQAITAGYMRYVGLDGCHWCLG